MSTFFGGDDWRPYLSATNQRVPCIGCGALPTWRPRGWWFRYPLSVRGQSRHGAKVKSERLCAECAKQHALPGVADDQV